MPIDPSIPLQVQTPNLGSTLAQIYAIKGAQQQQQLREQEMQMQQQEAPYRLQALQQQAQIGQAQLQEHQQAQQDNQSFRSALQDPSLQGKTIGQIADALAHQGKISQAGWVQAKKADLENQTALAGLDKEKLANLKAAHDQTQQLYNNVMNLPDDQIAAQWPQIAAQYDAIPGNQKQPLNPNQPMTKQQLQQFGPLLSMNAGYLDAELARREAAAKAKTAEQTAEAGGTTDLAKFQSDYLKANNLENTPANRQKAFDVYTQKTKIAPAEVRAQVLLQTPTQVYNPETQQTTYVTRKDAIGQQAPSTIQNKVDTALEKSFTSGDYSKQLNAINTAREHMKTFNQLADALSNGDVQLVNKIGNELGVQLGSDKATNFRIASQAFGGEVGRAFDGAGVTAGERSEAQKAYSENMGPGQFKGAIRTVDALLAGKQTALKRTYDQGKQGKPNFGDQSSPQPVATHRYNPQTGQIEAIK